MLAPNHDTAGSPAPTSVWTVETWTTRIAASWRQGFLAILEVGKLLGRAKSELPHGEWETMCKEKLPFSHSTAQRLMAIADDARISNPAHVQHLPPHWGTLYELTKLSDEEFEKGIQAGAIRPDMERKALINGARSLMGARVEDAASLDYFPTPPWATRALIEKVLPQIGQRASFGDQAVWEPACGEGHIAEVLTEYAGSVSASDIFAHGYGDVADFLNIPESKTPLADWIITNPPFNDLAEKFVIRSLELARVGVAMFLRLQWLESVGRYERIFQPHAPKVIAQFAERVPLYKGQWVPNGTTATAYLWIVWLKSHRGRTQFFWIPPGCREALTKPNDAERFTAHPVTRRGA